MRSNLGWFTKKGFFVGILLCLSLGLLIYRQFDFTPQPRPDDVLTLRISLVEKELKATQSKVNALEQRLHDMDAKLTTCSSRCGKAKKKS